MMRIDEDQATICLVRPLDWSILGPQGPQALYPASTMSGHRNRIRTELEILEDA
jgi:hypothetical protein